MKKYLLLITSHFIVAVAGFALGIYLLPILTAPPAPSAAEVTTESSVALYTGQFRRDLKDSDLLHWGEGKLSIGARSISLLGKLAPGPNYKLYLSREFVDTEADFLRLKASMVQLGDIKTFENFVVPVPQFVNVSDYNSVIVWCESFNEFITAAQYR